MPIGFWDIKTSRVSEVRLWLLMKCGGDLEKTINTIFE